MEYAHCFPFSGQYLLTSIGGIFMEIMQAMLLFYLQKALQLCIYSACILVLAQDYNNK